MRLALFVFAAALLIGIIVGGRPSRLADVRFRWPLLGLAGIALQLVPASGTVGTVLLVASFVLLGVVCIANIRLPGFVLILIGLSLNFLVIAVNGGMPVTAHALVASGQRDTLTDLVRHGGSKHHLATSSDHLVFLADSIPIGPPIRQAVSVGDILAYTGAGWFIVSGMRRKRGVGSPKGPHDGSPSPWEQEPQEPPDEEVAEASP